MIERLTRDQALMDTAMVMSRRSTCSRASVGVVIAREGRILSTGYNGAPAGMRHCDHECNCRVLDRDEDEYGAGLTPSGYVELHIGHTKMCATQRPCTVAIHAEANAIGYAARHGMSILEAELYTTFCPCLPCAQLIVTVGITTVIYKNEYRDRSGLELLRDARVNIMLW